MLLSLSLGYLHAFDWLDRAAWTFVILVGLWLLMNP